MATISAFIGIDRHASPDVRDLTGARRDARALSCLFSDSIPDANITNLCDEQATTDAVRHAIAATLGAATATDTVIFSFSGHGTADHRLVLHDTRRDALHATTISMDDIASAFRDSKAGMIICIIDCCFSGGAPAKVLENTPVPRDPHDPYENIIGNGRVLIAACNTNEVAYEHPYERHGLLTKAVIAALCSSDEPMPIGKFLDYIMDSVRAEAGKIGIIQTPYLVNKVVGGMTLPVFRKGDAYRQEFPEAINTRLGTAISELSAFDLPANIINKWNERYPSGLNALQQQAINDGNILNGQSLLVVAPTSSGKTFIGELATVRAVAQHRKAVFLFPYKALVNEKFDQFQGLYGEHLDYRIIRCTGDYGDQISAFIQGKYELAILTYEMFLNVALDKPALLNNVGLVVLDEAQFITDPTRGITVELLLTYLLSVRERGIQPQLIALSAVIGEINNFDAWLDCRLVKSEQRPVPLVEGVIDRTGIFQYVDVDGLTKADQLVPRHAIRQRNEKPSAQDVIVPLAQQLIAAGEKIIVFRNMRGKAQGCAAYLAHDLSLPPASDALAQLPNGDHSAASNKLHECLSGGTAFHTSNLTREEREVVERNFRQSDGAIKILGATTTVAAGINTPADTVIIAEQEFKGEDGRQFTVSEYKNMAGRAGRLGIRDRGRSIIYAENSLQRQQLFDRYVKGSLGTLHSSFDIEHLDTWLIRLLAQVRSVPKDQVIHILCKTYGGYLENRRHPKWQQNTVLRLNQLMQQMLDLGLLEEEMGKVKLTLLGRACGESMLSFNSAMRLVRFIRDIGPTNLTPFTLMALIQALDEMDKVYTPLFNKGKGKEAEWPSRLSRLPGVSLFRIMQSFANDETAYVRRCKRICILSDWINGVPSEMIERTYTINPFVGVNYGDIRSTADSTRFLLRSARKIVSLLLAASPELEEQIEILLQQLEVGVPADGVELLSLSVPLQRGDYLAMYSSGIMTPSQLWQNSPDQLLGLIGPQLAGRLERFRPNSPPQSDDKAA